MLESLLQLLLTTQFLAGCYSGEVGLTDDELWRIVAKSNVIVVGRLTASPELRNFDRRIGEDIHTILHVVIDETLKGSARSPIEVSYYTGHNRFAPSPEGIMQADSRGSII